jgi:hypothetical protein
LTKRPDEVAGRVAAGARTGDVLSYVGIASVIGATLVTGAAVVFGPAPYTLASTAWVRSTAGSAIEPADRLALVGWYALAVVFSLGALWWSRRPRRRVESGRRLTRMVDGPLLALTAGIVVLGLVWAADPSELWKGLPLVSLPIAWLVAVVVLSGTLRSRPRERAVTLALAGLALAVSLPFWIQVPAALGDPYHFGFTSEEVGSVAAGHFPLSDFAPQYSVLLPYLFAPFLVLFPAQAPSVAVAGLLVLQLVTIGIAVALPALAGGRRYVAPAVVVVVPPLFVQLTNGSYIASYFQGMPLRDVLPMMLILTAFLVLRRGRAVEWRRPWPLLGLGAVCGATALNNPDFGIAAAAAVAITVALAQRGWRLMLRSVALVAAGAVTVFLLYSAVGLVNGTPVDWSAWLIFQTIFGSAGFSNVPMAAFGLHVVMVALFIGASVTGFVLLRRSVEAGARGFAHRQGLLLALTGGWSMLCLPYIAGRSLPPTYLGGQGFQAVLFVACSLPLFSHAWRSAVAWPSTMRSRRVLIPIVLTVGAPLAMVSMSTEPSARLAGLAAIDHPGWYVGVAEQHDRLRRVVPTNGGPDLTAVPASSLSQILPVSNMLSLTQGLASAAVTTSPDYIEASA